MSNAIAVSRSATRYGPVTKSDTTVLQFKRIYVGGAGNVVVLQAGLDQAPVTFTAVPAGTQLEVSGTQIMQATTATNMVWMDW